MAGKDDLTIHRGGDNVFADLGYAEAATHKLKAELAQQIRSIIRARGLTQAEAGDLMGVGQPDVSRILQGKFRDVSVERLMRMITHLDMVFDITLRPREEADAEAIHLHALCPA